MRNRPESVGDDPPRQNGARCFHTALRPFSVLFFSVLAEGIVALQEGHDLAARALASHAEGRLVYYEAACPACPKKELVLFGELYYNCIIGMCADRADRLKLTRISAKGVFHIW